LLKVVAFPAETNEPRLERVEHLAEIFFCCAGFGFGFHG
jgi:hypothetical protein